ncbi:unnamed protein product, partial [Rotaria socialis]
QPLEEIKPQQGELSEDKKLEEVKLQQGEPSEETKPQQLESPAEIQFQQDQLFEEIKHELDQTSE